MHTSLENQPWLHQEELKGAWREALHAQRSTLTTLFRDHIISEETYADLVSEVDTMITDPESTWPDLQLAPEDLEPSEEDE